MKNVSTLQLLNKAKKIDNINFKELVKEELNQENMKKFALIGLLYLEEIKNALPRNK